MTRRLDYGPAELTAWVARAAHAVEERYPDLFQPRELVRNPAFYCLMGRSARQQMPLDGAGKSRLLLDDFFLAWLVETPVMPVEAARGAFGYMLLRHRDAPDASRVGAPQAAESGLKTLIIFGFMLIVYITLIQILTLEINGFKDFLHLVLLLPALILLLFQMPPMWKRVQAASWLEYACRQWEGGKTFLQKVKALPRQIGDGLLGVALVCALIMLSWHGAYWAYSLAEGAGIPGWACALWAVATVCQLLLTSFSLAAKNRLARLEKRLIRAAFKLSQAEES
jgi:hypothetical protein